MRLKVIPTISTVFSIVCLLSIAACTRITTTEIGAELIPSVDGVNTFDTVISVETDSFLDTDTARIYRYDNQVLGAITSDPLFGKTTATLNFELRPTFYPFFILGAKDSTVVDSAVLIMSYKGFYGDSSQPLRLTVSEISRSTPLNPNIIYPADYPALYPVNTVGNLADPISVDIRRAGDSVKNRFENAANQIRIKLYNSVAQRFIKTYDSTNAYLSDSAFSTFFAGFALKVDAVNPANALMYVNMLDSNTKLGLYYSSSSTGATVRDTAVTYFRFNSLTSGLSNFITRNRAGSEVAGRLTTTSRPDSLVYVQTTPGTYVRIKIPALSTLSNRIIHRAELITEQVPDDANLLTLDRYMYGPRILLLSIYDSINKRKRNIPNDYSIGSNGPNTINFGGYRIAKTVPGYDQIWSYVFNISRYVQGIVTRKDTSFILRLSAPSNDSIHYTPAYPNNNISQTYYLNPGYGNEAGQGRIRLGGGTHSRFRMRLRIVYSKI
jgi:hypothetical protein